MTTRPYFTLPKTLLCVLFAIVTSCAATARETPEISQPAPAKAGSGINQSAPDFKAVNLQGRSFGLSDYRGKNVVLVFYVGHR